MLYYQDSEDVQSQPECPDSLWKCPHLQQRLPVCRRRTNTLARWRIYSCVTSKPHSLHQSSVMLWINHFWIIKQHSLLQARMWTLCVGSTLVFGPILGKTWRLYRVFTQRVPDKRVVGMLRPPGARICFQHQRPWIVLISLFYCRFSKLL